LVAFKILTVLLALTCVYLLVTTRRYKHFTAALMYFTYVSFTLSHLMSDNVTPTSSATQKIQNCYLDIKTSLHNALEDAGAPVDDWEKEMWEE